MSDNIYENLTQLGSQTALPNSPEKAVLERVPNPKKDMEYCVRFTAPDNSLTVNSGALSVVSLGPLSGPSSKRSILPRLQPVHFVAHLALGSGGL